MKTCDCRFSLRKGLRRNNLPFLRLPKKARQDAPNHHLHLERLVVGVVVARRGEFGFLSGELPDDLRRVDLVALAPNRQATGGRSPGTLGGPFGQGEKQIKIPPKLQTA
jgi:hypothetical protein